MGFVHRHPQRRGFLQASPVLGGTIPGVLRLPLHAAPTHGVSPLRSCAYAPVFIPFSAYGALLPCPPSSAMLVAGPISSHSPSKEISSPRLAWFVPQYPRSSFPQEARRTPHRRHPGVLSTLPLSFGSLAHGEPAISLTDCISENRTKA